MDSKAIAICQLGDQLFAVFVSPETFNSRSLRPEDGRESISMVLFPDSRDGKLLPPSICLCRHIIGKFECSANRRTTKVTVMNDHDSPVARRDVGDRCDLSDDESEQQKIIDDLEITRFSFYRAWRAPFSLR
jgi:hypothetical protein